MRCSSILKDCGKSDLLSFQIFKKLLVETLIWTIRRLSLQRKCFNPLSIYCLCGWHYTLNLWLWIIIIWLEVIKDHLIYIHKAFICLALLVIQMKNIWLLILPYLSKCSLPGEIVLRGVPLVHIGSLGIESSGVLLSR